MCICLHRMPTDGNILLSLPNAILYYFVVGEICILCCDLRSCWSLCLSSPGDTSPLWHFCFSWKSQLYLLKYVTFQNFTEVPFKALPCAMVPRRLRSSRANWNMSCWAHLRVFAGKILHLRFHNCCISLYRNWLRRLTGPGFYITHISLGVFSCSKPLFWLYLLWLLFS